MEPPAPATPPGPDRSLVAPPPPTRSRRRRRKSSRDHTPRAESLCDHASGALILFLLVFTPWAFGTTQPWSIWTANIASYTLGLLLVAKWVIRYREGFQPPRWGEPIVLAEDAGDLAAPRTRRDPVTPLLATLTVAILAYTAVSALNARAEYDPVRRAYNYLDDPIPWLPHSYDRIATSFAFWQYLGLACLFWATRDWLLRRFASDARPDDTPRWAEVDAQVIIPARLQTLLWVLVLNGALLALVGILQRASGTGKLLWILPSASLKSPDSFFGPWSYRGNASQYFNLLWPVCLGFWLWAQERATRAVTPSLGRRDGPQILLLPCAIFMAACPMISTSRGGAIISVAIGAAAVLLLLFSTRRSLAPTTRWITIATMAVAAIAAIAGGWSSIRDRLLRTDRIFPTGIESGSSDFSFLLRLRVPDHPPSRWTALAGVSRDAYALWQPNAFTASFTPDGHCYLQILGSASTNHLSGLATNFVQRFAGQEILLTAVRQESIRAFVNDQEIPLRLPASPPAPGWQRPVQGRFAYAVAPFISSIALVNYALSPDEISAAAQSPAESLESTLGSQNSLANDAVVSTNELVFPTGVGAELITRPSDPSLRWMMVRREAGPGVVALRRLLANLPPRIRGPMRVNLTVWNPANDPALLAVALDAGNPVVVEIQGRSEAPLQLACRANHPRTPQVLDIYLCDEDGNALTDSPQGASFAVRDIRLQTDGTAFVRVLDRRLNPADLSDRMSGRGEVYANARRMADEHVWWGSGPGTFGSLYQFYRNPGQTWAAYAHDDWLETRITFGRIGSTLIVLALALILVRSWTGPGLPVLPILTAFWWLALGGCLVHAIFDFPFQIHSVLLLFIVIAATLTVLTARRPA